MRIEESILSYENFVDPECFYVVFFWRRSNFSAHELSLKYPLARNLQTYILREVRDFFEVFNWALINARNDPFQIYISSEDGADSSYFGSKLTPLFGEEPTMDIE